MVRGLGLLRRIGREALSEAPMPFRAIRPCRRFLPGTRETSSGARISASTESAGPAHGRDSNRRSRTAQARAVDAAGPSRRGALCQVDGGPAQLRRQDVDGSDDGFCPEELRPTGLECLADLAVQMDVAVCFAVGHVEDPERRRATPERNHSSVPGSSSTSFLASARNAATACCLPGCAWSSPTNPTGGMVARASSRRPISRCTSSRWTAGSPSPTTSAGSRECTTPAGRPVPIVEDSMSADGASSIESLLGRCPANR